MPTLTTLAACAALITLGASTAPVSRDIPAQYVQLSSPVSTDNHAVPELISDSTAIVPGKPFTIAIKFQIDEGWHLYHPSDDNPGMEPTVNWSLPGGIHAGKLQFPRAHRIETPAGVEHVFEDELVMLVDFTVDEQIVPDQIITIEAKLKWLCCREDQCRPERADVKLQLPSASVSSPNRSEDFAAWREAVRANRVAE